MSDLYKMNSWCAFTDEKTRKQFTKSTNANIRSQYLYDNIINTLSLLMFRFIYRNTDLTLMSVSFVVSAVNLVILGKLHPSVLRVMSLIGDVLMLSCLVSQSRESDSDFLTRTLIMFGIIQLKSSMLAYNSKVATMYNILLPTVILTIRWIWIRDYSIYKLTVLTTMIVFWQVSRLIVLLAYEGQFKQQWAQCQKVKRQNQNIEKLLHELPIPIILFDKDGTMVLQNSISKIILPQDVDVVSKVLSSVPQTTEQLMLSKQDANSFKEVFQKVIDTDQPASIQLAILGHCLPLRCQLSNQVYNKIKVVQCVFTELSDQSTLIFERISQSQSLFQICQLADQIQRYHNSDKSTIFILQLLVSMTAYLPYEKTTMVVCNLRNYFKFTADLLQLTYDVNQLFKINDDVPEEAFIDIIKLHTAINSIIGYMHTSYCIKFNYYTSVSAKHFNDPQPTLSRASPSIESKFNKDKFALISFNISMLEQLQVTIQIDFTNPLTESEMLFNEFDLDALQNPEYRKNLLQSGDFEQTQFIHTLHLINSIGGSFHFTETQDFVKVQLQLQSQPTSEQTNVLFDQYIGLGRYDSSSKLYQWNNDAQALRVKSSSQLIQSAQGIHIPQQHIIKPRDNQQRHTSLVQQRNLEIQYNVVDVSYKPEIRMEEEKKNVSSPISSPVIRRSQKRSNGIEHFDVNDRIGKNMQTIEKAVSKTLDSLLQEIMSYRGKKLNVQFKVQKRLQKSFETTPNNQMRYIKEERQRSVPHRDMNSDTEQTNQIRIPQAKSVLKSLRENVPVKPIINIDTPHRQEDSPLFTQIQHTFNEIKIEEQPPNLSISIEEKIIYNDVVTFLLVDDASFVIYGMAPMKFSVEKKFDSASKADDALKKIEDMMASGKLYHFIFLKIKMPKMDGYQILKEIRNLETKYGLPKQYVIATDTDVDDKLKKVCLEAGFDDALEKPIKQVIVEEIIQKRISEVGI